MARPSRCRRVCARPACPGFVPQAPGGPGQVILTVDEYEVIRLVDYERQTHGQCAAQMEISRTTVTEIYESARRKLADSLVNARPLRIDGGHYRLCRGRREEGCAGRCRRALQTTPCEKGENAMRIAVPYEDGRVFQHFGHTRQMKMYDVTDGQITGAQVVDTAGSGHGALAGFLSGRAVDVLLCGGIGAGAQQALAHAGIRLYGGVCGAADDAVRDFLAGTLQYQENVQCSHHAHDGGHGGCGGSCGEDKHGCAGHGGSSCGG